MTEIYEYSSISQTVIEYPLGGAVAYLDAFVGATKPAVFVYSSQGVQKRDVRAAGAFVREPGVLSSIIATQINHSLLLSIGCVKLTQT